MAGAVLGELGRRFERVESLVLWNCRHFRFWTWWCFRVAGATLRMPRAHFSWQATCFLHAIKPLFLYFQYSFSVVRTMFCENPTCARATPSSLCAHQIALIVAWCKFWCPSRNHLVTLWVSDRSPCGAVQILMSLSQLSRHFVRVGSLLL